MGNKGLIAAVVLLALFGVYLILISGCASTAPDASAVAAGNLLAHQIWCDDNQPERPARAAVAGMSRRQLDAINAHNERGAKWCGWTP